MTDSKIDGVHGDEIVRYLEDLTKEVVAETNNATDQYNLGKIILKTLVKNPQKINQIDAANDSKESNGELRARVLACARALKSLDMKKGDVLAVIGRNHLDVCIPLLAGFVCGVAVLPIDTNLKVYQLRKVIGIAMPRVVFCDSNKTFLVCEAIKELSLCSTVVAFPFPYGNVTRFEGVQRFDEFLASHIHEENTFLLPTFNAMDTTAVLISTSGTTGSSKQVELTHYNIFVQLPFIWSDFKKFPEPTRMVLNASSIHGMTAVLGIILQGVYDVTRVQSSADMSAEHIFYIINKYKPTFVMNGPTFANMLLMHPATHECDFTCIEKFYVGGSAPGVDLIKNLKKRMPNGKAMIGYGITEASSLIFRYEADTPIHSVGKPISILQYKLMDSNGGEILEYNKPGELLIKGDCIFKGYYNDEAATKETMTSDGYFRTGDLFYRDKDNNYFFVERIKMLIRYQFYALYPQEMEQVIMMHPGVTEAVVCGIPHEEDGEHPAACVFRSEYDPIVSAQEIKDLVKDTLSPNNQLRGGVLFLGRLPLLPSGKVDRRTIKEILLGADRE